MARINIDDELRVDPRFNDLCNLVPKHIAYGVLICLWDLGQAYWKKGELIPTPLAERLPQIKELVIAGFAVPMEQGYYCTGANERWRYLQSRSEAGKLSAEARREKFGSAIPCGATNNRTKSEQAPNSAEPTEPSSSSSSSSSGSKELNTYGRSDRPPETPSRPKTDGEGKKPDPLEAVYAAFPKRDGETRKKEGLRSLRRQIRSPEDLALAILAASKYREHCVLKGIERTEFVMQFKTWANSDWREWAKWKPSDAVVPPVRGATPAPPPLRLESAESTSRMLASETARRAAEPRAAPRPELLNGLLAKLPQAKSMPS